MVESITTRSRPSAPQKRACANGRSAEMPRTTVLSGLEASSLKRRSAVAQTPVSTLGKILSSLRLPAKADRPTSARSLPTRVKSGACAPMPGKRPSMRTGLPWNVTLDMAFSSIEHQFGQDDDSGHQCQHEPVGMAETAGIHGAAQRGADGHHENPEHGERQYHLGRQQPAEPRVHAGQGV